MFNVINLVKKIKIKGRIQVLLTNRRVLQTNNFTKHDLTLAFIICGNSSAYFQPLIFYICKKRNHSIPHDNSFKPALLKVSYMKPLSSCYSYDNMAVN